MSSQQLVTGNDIAQALSKSLLDVAMGRDVKKSKLQKQIEISDAINRRLQTQINTMKVVIEAKKHGVDFSASMKEIRTLMNDAGEDMGGISALTDE